MKIHKPKDAALTKEASFINYRSGLVLNMVLPGL